MIPPNPRWGDLVGDLVDAGLTVEQDRSVADLTTYRVGGPVAVFVEVRSPDELGTIARVVDAHGVPTLVIGRGSNLLVADSGFEGLALRLGDAFSEIALLESDDGPHGAAPEDGATNAVDPDVDDLAHVTVRAGAAALLPVVARRTASWGLVGFEWAVGVPGSVGGAVRMNAGGHGSDMAAVLARVRVVDLTTGEDMTVAPAELALGYRTSSIRSGQVVVSADLALAAGERSVAEERLGEIVRWRREHQPGGPNAGSVFANPPGESAGHLVAAAGLVGRRVGGAVVSDKHANFIQADPGGSADDVAELMGIIVAEVRRKSGIELRPETVMVGSFSRGRPT